MDTYYDSAGKVTTRAQIEQEYRKSLIVAGKELSGDSYDQGLDAWLSTYRPMTRSDKRSINASVATMVIGFCVVGFIALIVLMSGGGLAGFIGVLLIGGVMAFGFGLLVMMFTSLGKRDE